MPNLIHGIASIEIVQHVNELENRDNVVEYTAHGCRDLVWVRLNVRQFERSNDNNYMFLEFGEPNLEEVHEDNFRNFVLGHDNAA